MMSDSYHLLTSIETLAIALREIEKRLDERIGEMDRRLDERSAAQDKAETIADRELRAWKDAHNEASDALLRSYSEKLSRTEYDVNHRALIDKVDKIEETLRIQISGVDRRVTSVEGRATGVQASLGWIMGGIALALSLYTAITGHPLPIAK